MRRRRATTRRSGASPRCRRSRNKSVERDRRVDLALHDAQSVIAREHGFPSWTALREEVEARTLSFAAAVDEFIRCATGGAAGRAQRLLTLYPEIASATLQTALVLGDAASVEARLREDPALATAAGRTAELGAAALRLPHVPALQRAFARWTGSSRSRGGSARSARIRMRSITGTGTRSCRGRRSGAPSARSGTCRSPKCCSRPARIRPTASRCTSPAAAATSRRSNCCTGTAST